MQINGINKCCKPRPVYTGSFAGDIESKAPDDKKRYKHFEQLSDEVLGVQSILKAHRDVEQSGKMKLFKAMPAITTGLATIGIALTQPGKLSAKTASGLGFLASLKALDILFDGCIKSAKKDTLESSESDKTTHKHEIGFAIKVFAGLLGGFSLIKAISKGRAGDFINSEVSKLADEINTTKLGQFTTEKIQPFIEKHPKLNSIMGMLLPITSIVAGNVVELKLAQDLTTEIENKAENNFIKAKTIQEIAKQEFDELDAIEI